MNSSYPFVLIWTIFLWMLGWALLPAARQIFRNLPDGGLAAGRISGLALLSLGAFWLAALHVAPLTLTPVWLVGVPLLCLALTLGRAEARRDFWGWVKEQRNSLFFSDAIFLLAWFFFLWIRARNPGIVSDLEKPMDAALLGALTRADNLPFDNPWMSGTPFTNYYYFGPLMGAGLARTLGGLNFIAYNLVQPAFCALFVSTLWSVCAAVTNSKWRGVFAMAMVALLGNLEPLRQIFGGAIEALMARYVWSGTTPSSNPSIVYWPLGWWKTTRVIPNTINEYPAFTMTIGDAHAHFYELAVTALFFALCHALFQNESGDDEKADSSYRDKVLLGIGALLGVIWLTNTWDVPLYALLALGCALWSAPNLSFPESARCFLPLVLAKLLAWPFTHLSHPNVSGAVLNFWLPDAVSFLLIWGGPVALVIIASGYWKEKPRENRFAILLAVTGMIALIAPFCFYMRGVFGDGDFRHQDTVFKFGLQAWLLLGTAGACGAISVWSRWPKAGKVAALAYLIIPALCAACVLRQRAFVAAPTDINGTVVLTLNGAQNLPASDQAALGWLIQNAKPGEAVLEAVGQGSYNSFARVSSLTGVSTPLGWVQHVSGWGGDAAEIARRQTAIEQVMAWRSDEEAKAALASLKVQYVFIGELERQGYRPFVIAKLREKSKVVFEDGESLILAVGGEERL